MKKIFLIILTMTVFSYHVFSNQSAVVTTEPISAKIGNEILQKGGNAFDAAVAIGFALSVTYPRAGNISGGGFAMIYKIGNEPISLDFREQAPLKAKTNMYLDKNGMVIDGKSTDTIFSVGIPGTIKGLYEIWEKYGYLPFDTLLEPAIKIAENGVLINKTEEKYIEKYKEILFKDTGCSNVFFENSKPLKEGQLMFRKNLAKSLKQISINGEKEFYQGTLGETFVSEIKKLNGIITLKDLKNYKVYWRTPIKTHFKNDTLYLMPLPSSGGIVISQILSMLGNFQTDKLKPNSVKYIHLISELEKRCYADRNTYLGDPEFFPINTYKLLDKTYLNKRAKEISLKKATPSIDVKPGFGDVEKSTLMQKESEETTSYAVLDKMGNCISITYTLNGNYGCKILLPETGILLNNEMDDFSSKPGTPNLFGLVGGIANKIEPKKRMLSSMTPAIVLEKGNFKMALGSPGGSTIITSVLQNYLNISLFDMSAEDAVNFPRFHHQWLPDQIDLEPELFDNLNLNNKLKSKGQTLNKRGEIGNCVIILSNNNKITASADKRGTGLAIISK